MSELEGEPSVIRWRLHLRAAPVAVYRLLAEDEGRARFWAESAVERDGEIDWRFPDGLTLTSQMVTKGPPHAFVVEYFGGSIARFDLADDGAGGTDLTVTDSAPPSSDRVETYAGWISVLLALKGAADFGVDLRNHDPRRAWEQGFVDN